MGEFVSGLLLSPYPPQIRQSPTHIPPDILKRAKGERKRNNSNCSSLDSEPPSPTPRITRPGQNNTLNQNRKLCFSYVREQIILVTFINFFVFDKEYIRSVSKTVFNRLK